jgi:hypothetical protein
MAPNSKFPEKNRSVKPGLPKAPAPVAMKEIVAEPIAAEPVESVLAETKAAPIAPAPSLPEATVAVAVSAESFDIKELPLKTFDLLNENAAALFDFAAELSKVKSVADVIALQSRFASERYTTFLRQSNEVADLTRQLALGAGVSFRHSFSAFAA